MLATGQKGGYAVPLTSGPLHKLFYGASFCRHGGTSFPATLLVSAREGQILLSVQSWLTWRRFQEEQPLPALPETISSTLKTLPDIPSSLFPPAPCLRKAVPTKEWQPLQVSPLPQGQELGD